MLVFESNIGIFINLSKKTVIECIHGLMSQVLKDQLVNKVKNN